MDKCNVLSAALLLLFAVYVTANDFNPGPDSFQVCLITQKIVSSPASKATSLSFTETIPSGESSRSLHSILAHAGQYYGEPEHVLVNNKCKCIKVTSRFVPSKENPGEEILERNIRITVPLSSRMNISDPYSPIRTHFNYNLWDICKKCDPAQVYIGGQPTLVSQASCSGSDNECYTYDRNKCYTTEVKFRFNTQIITKKIPLNPESCYE